MCKYYINRKFQIIGLTVREIVIATNHDKVHCRNCQVHDLKLLINGVEKLKLDEHLHWLIGVSECDNVNEEIDESVDTVISGFSFVLKGLQHVMAITEEIKYIGDVVKASQKAKKELN